MTKLIRNNQKGFTLIELMIVVAIIGILAAIAIPNFLQYQLKSKTAEAKTTLGSIKTAQEAYRAENDVYMACVQNPAIGTIGAQKQAWGAQAAGSGWFEIGLEPSGDVYYSYLVGLVAGPPPTFSATASGDLDADGVAAVYTITTTSSVTGPLPVGEF